jgi:hypothetical protein
MAWVSGANMIQDMSQNLCTQPRSSYSAHTFVGLNRSPVTVTWNITTLGNKSDSYKTVIHDEIRQFSDSLHRKRHHGAHEAVSIFIQATTRLHFARHLTGFALSESGFCFTSVRTSCGGHAFHISGDIRDSDYFALFRFKVSCPNAAYE